MNLVKLSNIFKTIVDANPQIASYHFGYHSDVQRNVPNAYDTEGDKGTQFPHLTWVAPVEGELDLTKGGDYIDVELYLYDLQAYGNDGSPTSETLLSQWNRLKTSMVECVSALNKARHVKIKDSRVEYFTDANAHLDSMICVGAKFKVYLPFSCADYTQLAVTLDSIATTTEDEYA